MVFIDDESLLITSAMGYCLEKFYMPMLAVSVYAGKCETQGALYNVPRQDMRITRASGIAFNGNDTIYFSLQNEPTIIQINTETSVGRLLYQTNAILRYFSYSAADKSVYFTSSDGFGRVRDFESTPVIEWIIDAQGFLGSNLTSTDIPTSGDLVQLNDNQWLIADSPGYRYCLNIFWIDMHIVRKSGIDYKLLKSFNI